MSALLAAFVISLGLHALALFGPEIEIDPLPDPPRPLVAELRPAAPSPLPAAPAVAVEASAPAVVPSKPPEPPPSAPKRPAKKKAAAKKDAPPAAKAPAAPPVLAVPGDGPGPAAASPGEAAAMEEAVPAALPAPAPAVEPPAPAGVVAARLPPGGRIRFRVDRGDSGFEIGIAVQEWSFADGRYRLTSSVETTGLAWLIRSVNIDMESAGTLTAGGLRPEIFGVRRSGKKARERALFDWEAMKIRVGKDKDYALGAGAQDLLSFYYQLGFLDIAPGETGDMPLATGKKYGVYRLENVGDETVEVPLGALRARHLRTPGENATEIWLAYDYRLLPVKIRHVDNDGNAFVQVATEIEFR